MKLLVFLACLCSLGVCRGQSVQDSVVPKDFVVVPNNFYRDYRQHFLVWTDGVPPQSFSAVLFDRWGGVVLETTDPHFNFDSLRKAEGTYTLRLIFSVSGREKPFELLKQITYTGFYCTG